MTKYQAIFAVNLKTIQDEGEEFTKKVIQKLTEEFKITEDPFVEKIGKRNLARPINKHNSALFFRVVFNAEPNIVNEFQKSYRLEKNILRVVVYIYDIPKDKKELQLKK